MRKLFNKIQVDINVFDVLPMGPPSEEMERTWEIEMLTMEIDCAFSWSAQDLYKDLYSGCTCNSAIGPKGWIDWHE